ncbi:hypothetical protein PQR62_25450 [Herbaspirillum lusitanum]|uniref:Uncharacterized protein n=1 Tax=Herbaspirillum lusitanum TaxID=213312 RepID=A0ABW9AHZ0_9BURK
MRTNILRFRISSIFLLLVSVQAVAFPKSIKREIIRNEQVANEMKGLTGVHYGSCRVQFTDSISSEVDDFTYLTTKHPLKMDCYSSEEKLVNESWVKLNTRTGIWETHFSGNKRDRRLLEKKTKVYQIQAVNSQGYAVTVDDINGDPKTRDREMYFCLLRPPKAVCGNGPAMRLSKPETNILPQLFELLRSVEFIDD